MFDDDNDDEECLPISRRSVVYHPHRKPISPNNENSSCDRRQSRISLNNSINLDDSIQTPKQLIDLYEKTIHLASKNQINIRNAFQIALVERLPEVLDLIAFDDQSHSDPNFIKVGSIIDTSAKIYGLRVDALHNETQRLSGSIQIQIEDEEEEEEEEKKSIKKSSHHSNKIKTNSFLVSDLSTISISNDFQFHPLQPSNMCQWSGGIGYDTIYADMVSYTMYSSSDFPLVHGFIDLNSRINFEYLENDRLLESTMKTTLDLNPLREVIKENEGENHFLACQNLREFSFNEESTESYIETIDECSLVDSLNQQEDEDQYAISDLRDEPMSFYHPDLQSTYTCPLTIPSIDASRFSFVDHVPFLLREKTKPSDYTYFDPIRLRLFAGPYVWKYTNLLPDLIKQPSIVRQKSTRNLRLNFFTTHTLDKLMSLSTRSRRINKKARQTITFHQLRLVRRLSSINELTQLNHFSEVFFDENQMDIDNNDNYNDNDNDNYIPDVIDQPFEYDFIRPIHYEKIECEKPLVRIDTKKLQHNLFHEYEEKQSSTISFSNLCLNLIDKQQLSHEKTELISAFYCMLNNCHKNNLFMKSNSQQDDLIIQNQPFLMPTSQLTYTHQISN